ncbi:MAG: hypothetical protein IT290_11860 [Deltaproteobacteria bacterium]|nr:hypothetical protein [Deltaproteobacteria bacterium]
MSRRQTTPAWRIEAMWDVLRRTDRRHNSVPNGLSGMAQELSTVNPSARWKAAKARKIFEIFVWPCLIAPGVKAVAGRYIGADEPLWRNPRAFFL